MHTYFPGVGGSWNGLFLSSFLPLNFVVPEPPPHLLVVGHVHDVHRAEGGVAPLGERFPEKKLHVYHRNFVPHNFQLFGGKTGLKKALLFFLLQCPPRPSLEHSSSVPTVFGFPIGHFTNRYIFFFEISIKMTKTISGQGVGGVGGGGKLPLQPPISYLVTYELLETLMN